ncbi:hypothetical protein phytr_4680 [Candidatus Phycorickettsia trachydisci]|uniref:Uncharacterized protein n=1 Tax=Candidatus Phycorickettsia trachydisci TaxID=2115978 RepID=A0A2P1P836_9RICK|nr:glycosyltransferase [Candidatus Phycorickettsia trachydisci]AVP87417.1 hypothetical protein phytr_4680 [Candidatus Phycorickettsia trachydisci]
MLLRLTVLFLILNRFSFAVPYNNVIDVDFIQSMTDGNEVATKFLKQNAVNYEFLKNTYEAKKPSKMPYLDKPLIPKVMHHVWDGDLPPLYQNYFDECKKLHPDWEFKFWSDEDIRSLNLENQDLYDKSRDYAGRSDIARYEILYKFGGVYRDLDVKCLRPIDDLNHKYDFFAPIEYPITYWPAVINNGIIGANAGHPVLKRTLDIIRQNYDTQWEVFDLGNEKTADELYMMVAKVSMLPLTQSFIEQTKPDDKSIALPASYFYGISNVSYYTFWEDVKSIMQNRSPDFSTAFRFFKPETLMHHNVKKEEIFSSDFFEGNCFKDPQIKSFLDSLSKPNKRKLKSFLHVYNDLYPSKISFNKVSKITQVLHFVIFDRAELKILETNLDDWKMQNAAFEFKIWDQDKIKSEFKEFDNSDNFRFYIGLKILEKFGGSYADYRSKPHKPIFELNNKYNFYAGFMPLIDKDSKISLSQKLIGASPKHPIISSTLSKVNSENLFQINDVLTAQAYEKIYLYNEVNAKNIVFPAIYFEPFADLPKDTLWNKIYRFIFRIPKAFSKLTDFVVVE